MLEKDTGRARVGIILISMLVILLVTAAFTDAVPLLAAALIEGRNYDQSHDAGYIDWSGPLQYVYMTHRDNSSLPANEGGTSCGSGCQEWVTRIGNGGIASGSFDRDVSYFEVMVGFTHDSSVGSAVLRACSAVSTANLYLGPGGGLPGFVSMPLTVPAGCRSWSLSASSGYVDFRSVDVNYIAVPASPTHTSTSVPTTTSSATQTPTLTPTSTYTATPTFTPTLTSTNISTPTSTPTFTPTHTPTPIFTPTFTPTNTPSPVPTPLPPVIVGRVICDYWGDAGWCRGEEYLELTASDPQGLNVTISGDLNANSFTCGNSCSLPLSEGSGTANYQVTSINGRTASGASTWKRDVTTPDLAVILPPVDGRNGWNVSQVIVSANASDAISGLASLVGSMDEGVSWNSFPFHFTDGVHSISARARDVAGNEVRINQVIHVDTLPPVLRITSHSNGELAWGSVRLAGRLEDGMSGAHGGELSIDGGITWQAVSMDTQDAWSFTWQSYEVPNGQHTLQIRGTDQAGNVSVPTSITLIVDNGPPTVSVTERWWIGETGNLKITPDHFPIASVRVTIRDPQERWPEVVMNLNPNKTSFPIFWDRHFSDWTLAPSGEYSVLAVACDVNGLCGRDIGRIVIPTMATLTVTPTSLPIVTSTQTPYATSRAIQILSTPPVLVTPFFPEKIAEPVQSSLPLWQTISLLGLFMVIASANVMDRRPEALDRLGETFRMISSKTENDSFNNKQD